MLSPLTEDGWDVERAKVWDLFTPPARPSSGEVERYRELLAEFPARPSRSCLLLGCTPELRSLVHARACPLTCADKSESVFRALERLVETKGQEDFIGSDWQRLQLDTCFDIVLADGSLNMLHPCDHEAFLQLVYKALPPEGLALLRVHLLGEPQFADPHDVFAWRRVDAPHENIFTATRTHLDMLWYEEKPEKVIDFERYHERIRALHHEGGMNDEEFAAYDSLLPYNRIKLYYVEQAAFEALCDPLFTIEDVRCGKDYPCHEQHPIYALRKRVGSGV